MSVTARSVVAETNGATSVRGAVAPRIGRLGRRRATGELTVVPVDPLVGPDRLELTRAIAVPQVISGRRAFESRLVSRAWARSLRSAAAQRLLDVTCASVALVVAAPLFAVCALAVRLTSRGPVIFRQTRIGRRGKPFECLKFRTMRCDAEAALAALLLADEEARAAFEAVFKLDDDPRITRVGRFLRRTCLDELPQLLNVLRGEMSMVGPRPVVPQELMRYGDYGQVILQAKPGMTGAWQVARTPVTTYAERVLLDVDYVLNRTIAGDIEILAQTLRRLRTAGENTAK
jgi:lipopolysaccharide/colanic/teichoic acid biosynthesis glycosyltransferase